jgi:hypothetical protein
MMPRIFFRKGKCFPNIASVTLPKRVVPPFHMRGFARFSPDVLVRLLIKYGGICIPEVPETLTSFVCLWNLLP